MSRPQTEDDLGEMESAHTPFLSGDERKDTFSDDDRVSVSRTEKQTDASRRRRCHPRAIFHGIVHVLAIWGLVSLGWQATQTLLALQSPSRASSSSPSLHDSSSPTSPAAYDVYRPETLAPGLNECDCGPTTADALSRGCKYDSLSTAWLPPYCRDDALTAEFDRSGPNADGSWGYFADAEGLFPLSADQVAALGERGGSFWASRDWHVVHCLYYWRKHQRMRATNAVMEARFDSEAHVEHCTRLIRKPAPDHFFLIEVPVMMNSSDLHHRKGS